MHASYVLAFAGVVAAGYVPPQNTYTPVATPVVPPQNNTATSHPILPTPGSKFISSLFSVRSSLLTL
jgi:hypothetical protein